MLAQRLCFHGTCKVCKVDMLHRLFTKEELSSLQAGFQKWAGAQATLDKQAFLVGLNLQSCHIWPIECLTYVHEQGLLSLEQIDDTLGQRLFAVVSEGKDRVSLEQLVIAKARCLKASRHHAQHHMQRLKPH